MRVPKEAVVDGCEALPLPGPSPLSNKGWTKFMIAADVALQALWLVAQSSSHNYSRSTRSTQSSNSYFVPLTAPQTCLSHPGCRIQFKLQMAGGRCGKWKAGAGSGGRISAGIVIVLDFCNARRHDSHQRFHNIRRVQTFSGVVGLGLGLSTTDLPDTIAQTGNRHTTSILLPHPVPTTLGLGPE